MYAPNNPVHPIKFHQWIANDKVEIPSLQKQLRAFLIHTYIKCKQAACLYNLVFINELKHCPTS